MKNEERSGEDRPVRKKGRRANNDGGLSAVRSKDGKTVLSWRGAVLYRNVETGEQGRKHFRGKTQADVLRQMKAFRESLEPYGGLPNQERTVGSYLTQWLDEREPSIKPKTMEDYRRVVDKLLIPALGSVPLVKLTAQDVNTMVLRLVKDKKPKEGQRALARLRMALGDAVRLGLLVANVAAQVRSPKAPVAEFEIWEPEQVARFLTALEREEDRLYALYATLLTLGLRSGEARGLRWEDIDLDKGRVHVRQQFVEVSRAAGNHFAPPKRDSVRSIDVAPAFCALLKAHKNRQSIERMEAGKYWAHPELVFTSALGTPLTTTNLARHFKARARALGLPVIRLHDLRDTAASTMLASNMPLPLVSEILGHQDMHVTLKRYIHVLNGQRRKHALGLHIFDQNVE